MLHIETNLQSPVIAATCQNGQNLDLWNYRENTLRKLAKDTTTTHAVNAIYYYELDVTHIDAWRVCTNKGSSTVPTQQQRQFHAYFAPMIIEKWALQYFLKAGLIPANTTPVARTSIKCACCQICNYPGGYEPINSEPPYEDMYFCDICERIYHWKCLKDLGCYTDDQREAMKKRNPGPALPVTASLMQKN